MAIKQTELISSLMQDITNETPDTEYDASELSKTISGILKDYNLNTDLSFVEQIATMKFHKTEGANESLDLRDLPNELQDAAFLPTNNIADIALKQDLDTIISQIPELYKAIQVTRDAICEADMSSGRLARTISFDKNNLSVNDVDFDEQTTMSKIEEVEKRLELDSSIKNDIVFNTLLYGEAYMYVMPYAKVFRDLQLHKVKGEADKRSGFNTFDNNALFGGYGYGYNEFCFNEVSLSDTFITESKNDKPVNSKIFTEYEIREFDENYGKNDNKHKDEIIDELVQVVGDNIHFIKENVSLPVLENSAMDLEAVYSIKNKNDKNRINGVRTFFEQVVVDANPSDDQFSRLKGVYTKLLPSTKLIPIRIDKTVIGYYYISDLTRPEQSGERRNNGLSGYALSTPSVGHDSFAPDQMFCEKVANKIIKNFDLKFMKDNIALHKQIVAILMSHKFNESLLRFIFIPAENVVQFSINKDCTGKGHSLIEPGLVTARMYMFLKMYSILYQINNSQVRVYNMRMSGIDKDYKQFIQESMRKFAARRITANDIFNYRTSMRKVSGGSELMMPVGTNGTPPISVDKIEASDAPINNELLESIKDETLDSTPVPTTMIKQHVHDVEFSKEVELSNTLFQSTIASCKIDLNISLTKYYKIIMRYETDIEPEYLNDMSYSLRMPAAKKLAVTTDMINNFETTFKLVAGTVFDPKELKNNENSEEYDSLTAREFKKQMLTDFMPDLDIERYQAMADKVKQTTISKQLEDKTDPGDNIVDEALNNEEGMM